MSMIARWGARLVGAGMLGATAAIHADLYANDGYRHIPRIGPLFLALVIGASILCLAVLAAPPRVIGLAALAGAVTELATAAGLITLTHRSLPGLHGFRESSMAPHYTLALVVEIIGVVVLGGLTLASLGSIRRQSPSR
jgi:hypothetical protein